MPANSEERSRRETEARDPIDAAYGAPEDEFGATPFASHHLSDIDTAYSESKIHPGRYEHALF
jgi:hypothetical protein